MLRLFFEIESSFFYYRRAFEYDGELFFQKFLFIFILIYGTYNMFNLYIKPLYFFEDDDTVDENKIKRFSLFNIYLYLYIYFLCYYYFYFFLYLKEDIEIVIFPLLDNYYFEFILNDINLILSFMVDIISILIILYSTWYMNFDKKKYYFFYLLYNFSLVMKLLIYSNSCLTFLICWEYVGLFSFLLISFWCNRFETRFASLKAFIINKIGDLFLLLGIIIILIILKNDNIFFLKSNYIYYFDLCFMNYKILNIISFCFLIAALIKSAQFFFHIWLFDAMEGPTPVSALLHAATMVTAGVILILKFNFFFINNFFCNYLLNFFGIFSGIFGALVAIAFFDIKKIIAGSTCSQIGLMMIALSSCSYMAAFFHLFIHAFFKALLFLTAGIFIHSKTNEQDVRKFEALFYTNPLTTVSFFISSFSLMGFTYTSGYFSKDFIFESFFLNKNFLSFFNIYIFLFVSSLSCYYSYRLFTLMLFKSFWHKRYFDKKLFFKIYYFKDTYNNLIIFLLIFFNILVIFSGFFTYKYFKELNLYFYSDITNYVNYMYFVNEYFFLILAVPFCTYFFLHFFSLIKRYFYMHYFWTALFYFRRIDYRYYIDELADVIIKLKILYIYHFFYKFIALKFYIDILYVKMTSFIFFLSYNLYLYIDRGIFEYFFQLFLVKIFFINEKKKVTLFLNNYKISYLQFFYYFIFILFYLFITYLLFYNLIIEYLILYFQK